MTFEYSTNPNYVLCIVVEQFTSQEIGFGHISLIDLLNAPNGRCMVPLLNRKDNKSNGDIIIDAEFVSPQEDINLK